MKFFLATARHTWSWTLRLGIFLLSLAALLLLLSRVLLPYVIDDYRPQVAQRISQALHTPVQIQDLALTWQGWVPTLRLDGFRLLDPAGTSTLASFDEALISVNIHRSLFAGRPVVSDVRVQGLLLRLEVGTDKRLRMIPQSADRPALPLQPWVDWLLQINSLDLSFDTLELYGSTRELPARNLGKLRLSLRIDGDSRLRGRVHGLRVQALAAVAAPFLEASQQTMLANLAPEGRVTELEFSVALGNTESLEQSLRDYTLSMQLKGLKSKAWKQIPGIGGLDGNLSLSPSSGQLDLDARAVRVDAANLLRTPVTLDTVAGSIHWRQETAGLRLESSGLTVANAALNARLEGNLTLFTDQTSPYFDLRLAYRDVDVGQAHRYLPATVMHPKLLAWLDQALVSGRVPAGTLVFRGQVADFPFIDGNGLFETRFRTRDTILDYAPGWPRFEQLEAEVVFRNRSMRIDAIVGQLFNTDLQSVQARMDDLKGGILIVDGEIRAPGSTMLGFLRKSPLAPKLGDYLAGMDATGENTLNLKLMIPFHDKPIEVKGEVGFEGGSVMLPEPNIALQRIEGNLGFTEEGLTGKDLRLLLGDEPVRLNIDTRTQENGAKETRFQLGGRLSVSTLLGKRAGEALVSTGDTALLSGKSRWDILLTIPDNTRAAAVPTLTLLSTLQGVEIKLPAPFGKAAEAPRDFRLQLSLARNRPVEVKIDYAPDIRAVMEFSDVRTNPRFTRGELRIGTGEAELPSTAGLNAKVYLSRFELPPLTTAAHDGPPNFAWLNTLDARVDELIVSGQRFSGVSAQAENREGALALELTGKDIAGSLYFPALPTKSVPLKITLTRLALNGGGKPRIAAARPMDPRAVPPISVSVENLSVGGTELGRIKLSAIPEERGLRLQELELITPHARISASGAWLVTKGGHRSSIDATLHSDDLGAALAGLGYKLALEGGKTETKLTASWHAPFPAFAPELLNGHLELAVDKGRIMNVDPGLGRVTGLLNPATVTRRLMLDFSDLLENGLAFDEIKGNVLFKNGLAHTDDLHLEGPSARIDIEGQFDLKERKYDQTITVTPRVSASLPIAGAIAGGPVVGAVMLLAERMLHQEIDKISRYQYRLTGSWDKPSLERTKAPETSPEPAVDDTR